MSPFKTGTLVVIFSLLTLACNSADNKLDNKDNLQADESKQQEETVVRETEKIVMEGWVINAHTEYLHTIVGFRTEDGKLFNLIFPGIFMQFGSGLYYKLTYHRINDTSYLPDFVRDQKANYFYLDKVELLNKSIKGQVKGGTK